MASEAYDDLDGGDEFEELDNNAGGSEPEVTDEQRAMAQGWKPRHLYRGPPERWTDAATFLAHGEAEWPVMRDQNRRMSERLARMEPELESLRNTVAEQAQAVRDAMNLARNANEQGYQRALRELKDKQRDAVDAGDRPAYDQIEEQIAALEQTRAQVVEPPAATPPVSTAPPAQPVTPAVQQFVADNASWFNDPARPALKTMMIAFHNEVIAERQIVDVGAQLAEARARLAERYPDQPEFASGDPDMSVPPRRSAAPPARTAAPVAAPRGAVPTGQLRQQQRSPFDQIADAQERKDAREAFARIQRQDPDCTAAEYVAMYLDPHADVLSLRRNHRK